MSDDQSEINNIKNILQDLSQNIEKHSSLNVLLDEKDFNLDKLNLSQNNIQENLRYKFLEKQVDDLKSENERLRSFNSSLKEKYDNSLDAMKSHEQKMRDFFNIFRAEQEEKYRYQILVEKLKNEIVLLNSEIVKQEGKYSKLKNQMSYRLGSRLIGVKKKKDIIGLPKKVFEDYIDFKTNLNKESIEVIKNPGTQLLAFNNSTNHILFDSDCSFMLKPQFVSVILDKNIAGNFDLQLYGVKVNTSVDIQVRFQALDGSCTLQFKDKSLGLHQLQKGEHYVITFTMTDDVVFPLFNILSNKGGMKVSFKKTRGVPSCLRISNNDESKIKNIYSKKIKDTITSISKKPETTKVVIPTLKKPNAVLFEADQIIDTCGKEVAKAFAEKNIKNKFRSALNVLNANIALGDDEEWLNYINEYLSSFGCSPIRLTNQVNKNLYYRIRADKTKNINSNTKVSIIMPAFNAESTIKNAINSILSQTWTNIELIVVNDCSEDSTWEIIRKMANEDSRIVAINNPSNVGAYVSKNIGLRVAIGHYITGHDSDDWAHPQRIENHLKAIDKEIIKPKASLTRMIRMEENGYFPFYLEGTFCLDGVLRVASITCMFETSFLRDTLGGWDCSRFGADSEIIARAKIVLGEEFKDYHQVSMICLNAPNSLTNNPIHGVQRGKGLSPSRKFYKDQWTEWHKTLDKDNVYLEFPHINRNFEVPVGTDIATKNILEAMHSVDRQLGNK